jgi:chemotaxis protein methyltransferase CheR
MLTTDEIRLTPSEFRLFQELMYRHAGVRLGPTKHTLVQNRLRKRLRALGLSSYGHYHHLIADGAHPGELQECLNCLTTNETYFFRHRNHWDFFTREFLPEMAARSGPVRIWSAAASTGAEAYSAAIALCDTFRRSGRRLRVDATDINEDVLIRAREGVYDDYAVQKLTRACLAAYFEPVANGRHRVRESVRALVRFEQHNLLEPRRAEPYDLVFLRNVLIYFDEASKRSVLERVDRVIRPGGILILGGAESLSSGVGAFRFLRPTIYRKEPSPS